MLDGEEYKHYAIAVFYIVMAIGLIVFTINWGSTDWVEFSTNLDKATENVMDTVTCEVEFNGFRYSGLCDDRDEIFNFITADIIGFNEKDYFLGMVRGCDLGCIEYDILQGYSSWNSTEISEDGNYTQCSSFCVENYGEYN